MSVVTVVAVIKAKPGCEAAVEEGLRGLVPPTLKEEGCINYDFHTSNEDPSTFVFHENWESNALLDQHLESDHIAAFGAKAEDIIESLEVYRLTKQ
ncbi:MAG: putative quinol monooxygenase [Verrucomicrobiota bacterium]